MSHSVMHTQRFRPPAALGAAVTAGVAAIALAVSAPSSAAPAQFKGSVCGLVGKTAIQHVDVVDACTPSKTSHTPVATIWAARWGNSSTFAGDPTSCDFGFPRICLLDVQVWKPAHSSWWTVFKQQAKTKASPNDYSQPVPKLGTFAWADVSADGETLSFIARGYGIVVLLKHRSGAQPSAAENLGEIGGPMTLIARTIAARL
jgi:hypothetical protein